MRKILPTAIGTLVCLLLVEAGIRIAYSIRNSGVNYVAIPYMLRNFGPVPPWAARLSVFDPDDEMLWRGRPYAHLKYMDLFVPMPSEAERRALLRRFSPTVPDYLKDSPVWEISLNSDGFRDADFPRSKTPGVIRIVCLGDSWTFGHGEQQDNTYPRHLAALLKQDFPEKQIEVFNLGVVAYTSHEGLKLLREKALSLQPDIVLVGYGMNDSALSGWHDKDAFVPRRKRFRLTRFITENSELYKLAVYLGKVSKFESGSMGDTIRAISDPNDEFFYEPWASAEALEAEDFLKRESRLRVTPADYEANIRTMIRLIREHGAVPILLHNELRPGSPYQSALQNMSLAEGVPLVDNCQLIGEARRQIEKDLEQRMSLQPLPTFATTTGPQVEIVFRVLMDGRPVSRAMYIAGPSPQLGNNVPNRVQMYDDGTHGDQKAGDGVWSYTAAFSTGQKVFYVYTNGGAEGKWENVDLPKVRSFVVPASGGTIYRPIDTFGKMYLQDDLFHTNAQGYEIMAQAVRDVVVKTDEFRR